MGKILILIGIFLILLGIIWPILKKIGLGHLPGDIIIRKEGFTFYFPIVTCILISVVISIIIWLFNR